MSYKRIHCYAASFGDDLARHLIGEYSDGPGVVLDPFVGSGTTMVEALSAGHHAIGIDVDPIACLISRTLVQRYEADWLAVLEQKTLAVLKHLEDCIDQGVADSFRMEPGDSFEVNGFSAYIPKLPEIDFWFSPPQQIVLAALTAYMRTLEDERERRIFAVSVSSSIVRKWPNTLSLAMDIDHSRPHRAIPVSSSVSHHWALFRRVFRTTIATLNDLAHTAQRWPSEGRIIEGNCAEEMELLEPESIDLILSSPPYINAIDYPRSHKFSEWWLSPETSLCTRSRYIGLRGVGTDPGAIAQANSLAPQNMGRMIWLKEKQRSATSAKLHRYVSDMGVVIDRCRHVLKANGVLVFVLADNRLDGNVVPVVEVVKEMLERKGFRNVRSESRKIKRTRRRYPFGFEGVMDTEAVITALR